MQRTVLQPGLACGRGGFIKAGSEDREIGQLRAALARCSGQHQPLDFIESYKRGTIRFSTHPDLIRYEKDKLRKHTNPYLWQISGSKPEFWCPAG